MSFRAVTVIRGPEFGPGGLWGAWEFPPLWHCEERDDRHGEQLEVGGEEENEGNRQGKYPPRGFYQGVEVVIGIVVY